ncbi:hypothetical protein K7432_006828 [Basidiobolus ranarum]|uniref:Uncharacterized protein n=1 Tax=Basidiobolus ranarum TaxID=34480 RepID=A0ABR2WUE1_9FUNG
MSLYSQNFLKCKISLIKSDLASFNVPQIRYDIGESIREMDSKYKTNFQAWIRDSNNAHCISIRLRRLANESSMDQLAKAIRWIAEGWPEAKCRVLFSQVTVQWSECRKTELAEYLLDSAPSRNPVRLFELPSLRINITHDCPRYNPYRQSRNERKASVSKPALD